MSEPEPPKAQPTTLAEAATSVQDCNTRVLAAMVAHEETGRTLSDLREQQQKTRALYREIEKSMRDVLDPKPRASKTTKGEKA
jgi:hypothetical protein